MEPVSDSLITLIKTWFDYNAAHGILIRRLKTRSDAYDVINPERESVFFQGKDYDYATLCFVVYHGRFPRPGCIVDHINRIRPA